MTEKTKDLYANTINYTKLLRDIRTTRSEARAIIRKIQAEEDILKLGSLFDELRETNARLYELEQKKHEYQVGKIDEFQNALKGIF